MDCGCYYFYPLDAGYFLIFINYSFHCLQTLLISWKQLHFLKVCCSSATPGALANSCPSSQWCHPTISSSDVLFSSCLQSFPVTGSFLISYFFTSIGQMFNFSIDPSNEYSGFVSFRINWLDLLSVQGTLKSLVQHHSSKPSVLHCSPFFMVQLSHPYMTTGKIIALIILNFFSKVMSLLLKIFIGLS